MNTALLNEILQSTDRVNAVRSKLVGGASRLNEILNTVSASDEIPASVVNTARKAVEDASTITEAEIKANTKEQA